MLYQISMCSIHKITHKNSCRHTTNDRPNKNVLNSKNMRRQISQKRNETTGNVSSTTTNSLSRNHFHSLVSYTVKKNHPIIFENKTSLCLLSCLQRTHTLSLHSFFSLYFVLFVLYALSMIR